VSNKRLMKIKYSDIKYSDIKYSDIKYSDIKYSDIKTKYTAVFFLCNFTWLHTQII